MAGIVGYGAYIPKLRIKVEEIARVWEQDPENIKNGLSITEKSVPDKDEDTITISVEAARNALKRAEIDPQDIGAVFVGSESHPYTVKPSGTVVIDALGIGPDVSCVDTEFACRAGSTNIFIVLGLVKAGMIKYGLAIGADTSQGRPGDALEYTAAAGGAAFIIGNKKEEVIAELEEMHSISSDTPDFWRRGMQKYPSHAERFTGAPAYFRHLVDCTKAVMQKAKLKVDDIDHVAFHTPNGKFPTRAGEILKFPKEKLQDSLIVSKIGNTYSAASMLVLTHILDKAKPNERILLTSFGSGAGSDAFIFRVTNNIKKLKQARTTKSYMDDRRYVSYAAYRKLAGVS